MIMKFGYTKEVFGVISTSPVDVYTHVSKVLPDHDVSLVEYGETSLPDCDVAVFASLKTFIDCRKSINSNMVTVVCGGPLQVDSIPDIVPLDYKKSLSYVFDIIQPEYRQVKKAVLSKKSTPKKVSQIKISHLTLIIDNTASGGVLATDWNRLMSVLNGSARNKLRAALVSVFDENKPIDVVQSAGSFLQKGTPAHDYLLSVMTVLKSKPFKTLRQIIVESFDTEKKSSIETIMRRHKVEEEGKFEIVFFRKMVMSERFNSAKTGLYYEPINKR